MNAIGTNQGTAVVKPGGGAGGTSAGEKGKGAGKTEREASKFENLLPAATGRPGRAGHEGEARRSSPTPSKRQMERSAKAGEKAPASASQDQEVEQDNGEKPKAAGEAAQQPDGAYVSCFLAVAQPPTPTVPPTPTGEQGMDADQAEAGEKTAATSGGGEGAAPSLPEVQAAEGQPVSPGGEGEQAAQNADPDTGTLAKSSAVLTKKDSADQKEGTPGRTGFAGVAAAPDKSKMARSGMDRAKAESAMNGLAERNKPLNPAARIAAFAEKESLSSNTGNSGGGGRNDFSRSPAAIIKPAPAAPAANRSTEPAAPTTPNFSTAADSAAAANPAPTAPATKVLATSPESAVQEMHQAAERMRSTGQEKVEIEVRLHDGQAVTVQLQYRSGEVRATFRTESEALRHALEQSWTSFAPPATEAGVRTTTAVFAAPQTHSEMADTSSRERREQARPQESGGPLESERKRPEAKAAPGRVRATPSSSSQVQLYA